MATATYDLIASQTLGSAASSITFSSIAASWTDLRLILTGQGTSTINVLLTFNGDTGSNYSDTYLQGNGTAVIGGRSPLSYQSIYLTEEISWSGTVPTNLICDIFSYAGSTYKTSLSAVSGDYNGSGFSTRFVGLWMSTSAITSITITAAPNWASGTTAQLYGIKSA